MARIALLALAFFTACPSTRTEPPRHAQPAGGSLEVQSFSESQPYTSLTVLGDHLWAGTPSGLIRFELKSGQSVRVTREQGLPGNHVQALSGHPDSGLWVATDGGISRFRDGAWTNIPAAPGTKAVAAMVATSDGVWAGGPEGLACLRGGAWKRHLPGGHVSVMHAAFTGDDVWVGTEGEGIYEGHGDTLTSHSQKVGQPLRAVKSLAFTREGGLVAVGKDDRQQHALAFYDGRYWTSISVNPPGHLYWAERVGDEVLLAYNDWILALRRLPADAEAPKPAPDRVTLTSTRSPVAPSSVPFPRFVTRRVERWLPVDPTVVLGHGSQVFIGTRTAGAAAFDGKRVTWYRTRDLIGVGDKLRVGCQAGAGCFLVGNGRVLRLGPEGFAPVSVDADAGVRTQHIIESSSGLVALSTTPDGQSIVVSRLAGTQWSRASQSKLTFPEGRLEVRFARVAADGAIWTGLSYVDRDGVSHPWGVAILGADGKVLYHRSTLLPTEDRAAGSLALPDDIRDVLFAGAETWFATSTGICRVRGTKVDLYTENEGLESEIVYVLTRGPSGHLYAASHGGVGHFDGKWWRFDLGPALAKPTRALVPRGDQLWAATDAGLVGWSAKSARVIDSRQGLASDRVLDLYLEADRRMWILTDGGLSIITL
jgi:hypothetical protein